MWTSREALLAEAAKHERLAESFRRDADDADPGPARDVLLADAASHDAWAARLRRFADVW